MDLSRILADLKDCPCGQEHRFDTRVVEIASGLTDRTGEILRQAGFPERILVVSDRAAWGAADGILPSLDAVGFAVKLLIYDDMRYARVEQVREVEALSGDVDGILSVGTGSVNDICRVAAYERDKMFGIFGTAPSMDGFASDTAPIIANNFKSTWQAKQPEVILADTTILAKAPAELKAAGFGDMIAKYIGLFEWKFVHLLMGEYYCPAVAKLTRDAVEKMVSLADRVQEDDEEAAGAIMEALVVSGLAMKLAKSSRPASGAEHTISHYLECYKLVRGIWPEFHGKKVGVATVIMTRIYHNLAARVEDIDPVPDVIDWPTLQEAFTPSQLEEVKQLCRRMPIDQVDPARLKAIWPEVRQMIEEMIPATETVLDLMHRAGAVTELEDVAVTPELLAVALKVHPYMRYRMMPTRLMGMMQLRLEDYLQ